MTSLGIGGVSQTASQYLQQLAGQQTAAGTAASAVQRKVHRSPITIADIDGGRQRRSGVAGGTQAQVSSLLDTIARRCNRRTPQPIRTR